MSELFTANISRRTFAASAALACGAATLAPVVGRAEQVAQIEAADVVVVGAGAAGLAAAAKAAQDGASVIVLEAASSTGGTTKICGGHWKYIDEAIMAKLPERTEDSDATVSEVLGYDPTDFGDYAGALVTCQEQVREYLDGDDELEFDSVEYWLTLHHLYSKGIDKDGVEAVDDYDVVSEAYYNSGTVAAWLADAGLTWSDPQPNNRGEGGPLSVEPEGQGMGFINVLEPLAVDNGARIILNARATRLLADESGRVSGVVAEVDGQEREFAANNGVVLACGGYCSNPEMVAQENRYEGIDDTCPSCEPATCDGTGLKMAQELGAATANTAFVQFMGFPANQYTSIEKLFPLVGATKMMVNKDCERFCDDSQRFYGGGGPEGVRIVCDQPSGRYYMVGDDSGLAALGDSLETYEELGIVCTGDTLTAAGAAAGIDGAALQKAVDGFNACVEAGTDPDYGRDMTDAAAVAGSSYLAVPMAAYAQNTMGGVVISPAGEVLDESGAPIAGLYAAGEVVGNTDGACRRHGDNFAHILWYGYLAGKTLAAL